MKYLYLVLFAVLFAGCSEEIAGLTVDEFIADNNLTTKELDKGVHIVIDRPGNDTKPHINNRVVVNYVGEFTDGTQFEAGSDVEFQLTGLIEGWQIGLKEIGEGGSCKLIIPPGAGYGSSGKGSIPGNVVLVFDMDLLEVK